MPTDCEHDRGGRGEKARSIVSLIAWEASPRSNDRNGYVASVSRGPSEDGNPSPTPPRGTPLGFLFRVFHFRPDVGFWHIADIPEAPTNVRFWVKSGQQAGLLAMRNKAMCDNATGDNA